MSTVRLVDTSLPVVVREVGLRDGLQSIARTLPTGQEIEWLRAAHAAGLREIDVGSLVPAPPAAARRHGRARRGDRPHPVAPRRDRPACGHFHDTRGLGLADVYAATEDVAYLFRSMGVATGLDVDALLALRTRVAHWLEGEPLHGTIRRAGLPKKMREVV